MECGSVGPEAPDIRTRAIRSEYDNETNNREDEDNKTKFFGSIEQST